VAYLRQIYGKESDAPNLFELVRIAFRIP